MKAKKKRSVAIGGKRVTIYSGVPVPFPTHRAKVVPGPSEGMTRLLAELKPGEMFERRRPAGWEGSMITAVRGPIGTYERAVRGKGQEVKFIARTLSPSVVGVWRVR